MNAIIWRPVSGGCQHRIPESSSRKTRSSAFFAWGRRTERSYLCRQDLCKVYRRVKIWSYAATWTKTSLSIFPQLFICVFFQGILHTLFPGSWEKCRVSWYMPSYLTSYLSRWSQFVKLSVPSKNARPFDTQALFKELLSSRLQPLQVWFHHNLQSSVL